MNPIMNIPTKIFDGAGIMKNKAIKEYDSQIKTPWGLQSSEEEIDKMVKNISKLDTLVRSIDSLTPETTNWKPEPEGINYESRINSLKKYSANSRLDIATDNVDFATENTMNKLRRQINNPKNKTSEQKYMDDAKDKYFKECANRNKLDSNIPVLRKIISYLYSIMNDNWFPKTRIQNEIQEAENILAEKSLNSALKALLNSTGTSILAEPDETAFQTLYDEILINTRNNPNDRFLPSARNRYVELLISNRNTNSTHENLDLIEAKLNLVKNWKFNSNPGYKINDEINKIKTIRANKYLKEATTSKVQSKLLTEITKDDNITNSDKKYGTGADTFFMKNAKIQYIKNIKAQFYAGNPPTPKQISIDAEFTKLNDAIEELYILKTNAKWLETKSKIPAYHTTVINELKELYINKKSALFNDNTPVTKLPDVLAVISHLFSLKNVSSWDPLPEKLNTEIERLKKLYINIISKQFTNSNTTPARLPKLIATIKDLLAKKQASNTSWSPIPSSLDTEVLRLRVLYVDKKSKQFTDSSITPTNFSTKMPKLLDAINDLVSKKLDADFSVPSPPSNLETELSRLRELYVRKIKGHYSANTQDFTKIYQGIKDLVDITTKQPSATNWEPAPKNLVKSLKELRTLYVDAVSTPHTKQSINRDTLNKVDNSIKRLYTLEQPSSKDAPYWETLPQEPSNYNTELNRLKNLYYDEVEQPNRNVVNEQAGIVAIDKAISNLKSLEGKSKSHFEPQTNRYKSRINNLEITKANSNLNIANKSNDLKQIKDAIELPYNKSWADKAIVEGFQSNASKTSFMDNAIKKYVKINSNAKQSNYPSKAANKQQKTKAKTNIDTSIANLEHVKSNWNPSASLKVNTKINDLKTHLADEMLKSSVKEAKQSKNVEVINTNYQNYSKEATSTVAKNSQNEYLKINAANVKNTVQAVNKAKNDEINRSSHYPLPSVPEKCKRTGSGTDCFWGEQQLYGCHEGPGNGMTDDYVCKKNQKK